MARSESAARQLLEECGIAERPVDPVALAEQLGAIVIVQDMAADVYGMLLRRDGQVSIGVNGTLPEARQRFALAHAVGHLVLHRRRPLILDVENRFTLADASCLATEREEAEVNRFASALLMPEVGLRAAVREAQAPGSDLVACLAKQYGVTNSVAAYRLMGSGFIMDATA